LPTLSNLAALERVGKIAGNVVQNSSAAAGDFTHPTPLPLLDAWIGIAAQPAVAYPAH
jgi:hypothetical protein